MSLWRNRKHYIWLSDGQNDSAVVRAEKIKIVKVDDEDKKANTKKES